MRRQQVEFVAIVAAIVLGGLAVATWIAPWTGAWAGMPTGRI